MIVTSKSDGDEYGSSNGQLLIQVLRTIERRGLLMKTGCTATQARVLPCCVKPLQAKPPIAVFRCMSANGPPAMHLHFIKYKQRRLSIDFRYKKPVAGHHKVIMLRLNLRTPCIKLPQNCNILKRWSAGVGWGARRTPKPHGVKSEIQYNPVPESKYVSKACNMHQLTLFWNSEWSESETESS